MQSTIYKDIILEHWQYPRHVGRIKNPDIKQREENYSCGDKLEITIKLKGKVLEDVLFISEGCVISTAYASLFIDSILGKTYEDVRKISVEEVLALVGAHLTASRVKCALLCYRTIKEGLKQLAQSS